MRIGRVIPRVYRRCKVFMNPRKAKYSAALAFKRSVIAEMIGWYRGDVPALYETPSPHEEQKVRIGSEKDNAILTYLELHQKPIYAETLMLDKGAFRGTKLLDVGSSAVPSAVVFEDAEVYCLEPLLPLQLELGYPFWAYEQRARFIYGFAEDMPFPDDFFDAVISVNALDHVDDFEQTAREIQRVCKPNAKLRFHIHYHPYATTTEPLCLDDMRVSKAFQWCDGFKKIAQTRHRRGAHLPPGEHFGIWSNFLNTSDEAGPDV